MIDDIGSSTARSRIRPRSPTPSTAARRSSTSPPRRTSTARSVGPEEFIDHEHAGHARAARGGAGTRPALRPGVDGRGLRLDRVRVVHGGVAAAAVLAVQRDQDRRGPARRLATSTPTGWRPSICRGSNNYGPRQYPEKLIPLMILNALAGDSLPVYGDGLNVRNWLYVEDFGRGIGHGAGARRARARRTTAAARTRCRTSTWCGGSCRSDRRRRVADRVRHRSARARPPLLAVVREAGRAGLGGAAAVRGGARRDGRLVSRQRLVVGADPLGRVPRVLRAPLRARRSRRAERAGSRPPRGGVTRRRPRSGCRCSASGCCAPPRSSSPSTATPAPARSRSAGAPGCRRRPSTSTSRTRRSASSRCSTAPPRSSPAMAATAARGAGRRRRGGRACSAGTRAFLTRDRRAPRVRADAAGRDHRRRSASRAAPRPDHAGVRGRARRRERAPPPGAG